MPEIDLLKDAGTFRAVLASRLGEIAAQSEADAAPSAIEVGYDIDQGGWIFIHADRRPEHQRDGEWTNALDDDNVDEMPHWLDVMEENFKGADVVVHRIDGSTFTIPGYDEDAEMVEDEPGQDPLAEAIGLMIVEVLMQAKADGLFAGLSPHEKLQLDVEDFNGGWGWPEYDELGKSNLV